MRISARPPTLQQAARLLAEAGLPTDDLADEPGLCLFGIERDGRWVGVAGVQPLEGAALLRSLAVAPAERGYGAGAALVAAAERHAAACGWLDLFLLTTGASGYFERLGYRSIARGEAPAALRATRQFAQLCPVTAQVLRKRLEGAAVRR
jgi:N-acetylglutamate synthase-like GNAT family acetyltransferase